MKKIGLVLSGGGVRGIAHLGVIKALEEIDIVPSIISGTSSGAIIAALYSAGNSPEKIIELLVNSKIFGYSNLQFKKSGLFTMQAFEKIFQKNFKYNLIEKLPIPVCIAATDIVKGKTKFFSEGNLSKALLASSCIPLLFEPIKWNDTLYLDGGILNNLPVEPVIGKCDFIIGVHSNEMGIKLENIHIKDMLDRSFHLAMSKTVYDKVHLCDLFIEPPEMSRFGMFEVNKSEEIFLFAYQYTKDYLNSYEVFKIIDEFI
ncbi:MAG: patatin-like phospholipase family protein [Bacteroidia bacterium]|nr:patatin-like phospholipase family protein [Bacteroidia bacterium]